MKRLAVYGNNFQGSHIGELRDFFARLPEYGFQLFIESYFLHYLREEGIFTGEAEEVLDFPSEAECLLSIGGDGTFLRAAQWVGSRGCPILGLNTGHLGFMASYSLEETEELMEEVRADRGIVEKRTLLRVECESLPAGFWPYALNEVAVLKGDTASMVTIHADIDHRWLADYMGDGLVIATPTGSTAYNLSVGGPIVHPTLGCVILSPIAPHSLTMRPLVVRGDSEISLSATSRVANARVSLDGRSFSLECGELLRVREADFKISVLRRPDANFPGLLRNKLGWGTSLI